MGPLTMSWRLDDVVTRAAELADYFGKRTKGSVEAIKRSVYFGGSMSLSEGLHVERTEFLQTDQSEAGQELMLQYLADTGVHRRAAPLPPGHLCAGARSGPGARGRCDQRGGEEVSTAQPSPATTSRSLRARTPVPHGFTCRLESPRRRWSSSGTVSAPHARCAWTPSPSGSRRPASPPWRSPTATSATAAVNPASCCRSSDSSPTGMPPSHG